MRLYRVVGPNFVAGFKCINGTVVGYAPILRKWVKNGDKDEDRVVAGLKRSGVKVQLIYEI